MEKYKNVGGDSGVEGFEIRENCIIVKFYKTPKLYTYSYESAGKEKVETMKKLARSGEGLNEYINRFARNNYVK